MLVPYKALAQPWKNKGVAIYRRRSGRSNIQQGRGGTIIHSLFRRSEKWKVPFFSALVDDAAAAAAASATNHE